MRLRRNKPDYAKIARIEAELGLDDTSVLRQVEQSRKDRQWKEDGGVVELAPLNRLHQAIDRKREIEGMAMSPGARWLVDSPLAVRAYQPLIASAAASSNYTQIISRPSSVVLPTGVEV